MFLDAFAGGITMSKDVEEVIAFINVLAVMELKMSIINVLKESWN